MHIAVHLLLRLDQSALSVINVIFDMASDNIVPECGHQPLRPEVKLAAQLILVCYNYSYIIKSVLRNIQVLLIKYLKLIFRPAADHRQS